MIHEELCLRYKDVGIKVFCRVGSGTVIRELTRAQGWRNFSKAPRKVCIVRHPWTRLMSVWKGLFPGGTMPSRGYPPCKTVDDLIQHLLDLPPSEMEIHTRPMSTQLQQIGWWPKDKELITMEEFFRNPPYGIPKPEVHHHQSPNQPDPEISESLRAEFLRKYADDVLLYERAQKSPLSAGGKETTDGP